MTNPLEEIWAERRRQIQLKREGRFRYTPAEAPLIQGAAMLSEECGEVSRAVLAVNGWVQEKLTVTDLRKELIQVAAVALAMIEGIDDGTAF